MKKDLRELLKEKILILDGATGTELQKKGLPKGVCPEWWIYENPTPLIELQRDYVKNGSMAVLAPTFGANRIKLSNYGLENKTRFLNKELVKISRKAVGKDIYVLGDISSTGKFVEPFGELPFEEAVNVYKEQVEALVEAGVDGFFIETMIDIQEARAALIAVKETIDLPVFVSMTYEMDGHTLTGSDPITASITLASLGADAVGANCSTGPDRMVEVIKKIKEVVSIPVLAKPNAGLPKLKDGKTVFDMGPEEFASFLPKFYEYGINIIGGCCGTTPDHIKLVSEFFKDKKPIPPKHKKLPPIATSTRKSVLFDIDGEFIIIGERINPTGKKKLKEDIKNKNYVSIKKLALEQKNAGAHLLDINVGVPSVDEVEVAKEVIPQILKIVDTPLVIDSSNVEVFERILRIYPGRAVINSISFEKHKYEKLLPLVKKYGSLFIFLPLSEKGIPKSIKEKIEITKKALDVFEKEYNIPKEYMIIDGLVMTVSTGSENAKLFLDYIEWVYKNIKLPTTAGLSNISFGLPNRKIINTTFLSMATSKGLTSAIINPNSKEMMDTICTINLLKGADKNALKYIERFSQEISEDDLKKQKKTENIENLPLDKRLYKMVVDGTDDFLEEVVNNLLKEKSPQDIMDHILIPAIREVGDLYDKKIYFLPQLMMSANVMQKAVKILEPLLRKESNEEKGVVVFATVKGDIHDIGKNIVILMLRNNGFKVIDLGKDVDLDTIIEAAIKNNADIIGLSALMTTTMTEMPNVIKKVRELGLKAKVMVGGAVVDEEYAKLIGADGYSKDAAEAVKVATKLLEEK